MGDGCPPRSEEDFGCVGSGGGHSAELCYLALPTPTYSTKLLGYGVALIVECARTRVQYGYSIKPLSARAKT